MSRGDMPLNVGGVQSIACATHCCDDCWLKQPVTRLFQNHKQSGYSGYHDHEPSEKQANEGHPTECSISFFQWFWTSSGISQHMPAIICHPWNVNHMPIYSAHQETKRATYTRNFLDMTSALAYVKKGFKALKMTVALCRPTYCYITCKLCVCAILTSERSN